jgi:hypothetical protein
VSFPVVGVQDAYVWFHILIYSYSSYCIGITSAQYEKHLKAEEARVKKSTSRKGAVPLGPDDISLDSDHDVDYSAHDDDVDLNATFGHSPMGFIIQALRLEAAQYVRTTHPTIMLSHRSTDISLLWRLLVQRKARRS